MKRDSINYLIVGVFVTASAAAFLVFMYFVTGRAGPSDHYFAHYANVTGIKFGTGVFFEGYRVGQVEAIDPVPGEHTMRYKVTMSVLRDWRIPVDSTAEVLTAGLISQVQIGIRAGPSLDVLKPGGEIRGVQRTDLFAALSQAASGFNDLSANGVAPVLLNLNARITEVADDLTHFRRDELSPFIATLDRRLNQELAPQATLLLQRLAVNAQQLEQLLGPANQQRVADTLGRMESAATHLNTLITDLNGTRQRMDTVLGGINQLVDSKDADVPATVRSARAAMEQLQATLATVNENIASVMYNLSGSAQQMHELTRALRDNPTRILRSPAAAAEAGP